MTRNIDDPEVERLIAEVAGLTGESATEAVRKALEERRDRLTSQAELEDRRARVMRFLEREVWPRVPPEVLGRGLSKEEREEILGYEP